MAKLIPNTFQTFNDYVDVAMELLTPEEFKCLSFATRHILGWQDSITKRSKKISLTTFQRGMVINRGKPNERRLGGTGLSRAAIITALEGLSKYKLLVPVGKATTQGQKWKLNDSPDWDGLRRRKEEKEEAGRRRTSRGRSMRKTGQWDLPAVSPTDQAGQSDLPTRLVGLTESKPSFKAKEESQEIHTHVEAPQATQSAADSTPEGVGHVPIEGKAEIHQSEKPAGKWDLLVKVTGEALDCSAVPRNRKFAKFLTGNYTPTDGEWYEFQIVPGMTVEEIKEFGDWLHDNYDGKPLRSPEAICDKVAQFREEKRRSHVLDQQRKPARTSKGVPIKSDDKPDSPSQKSERQCQQAYGSTAGEAKQVAAISAELKEKYEQAKKAGQIPEGMSKPEFYASVLAIKEGV